MKILDFLNIKVEDIDGYIIIISMILFLIIGCFFGIGISSQFKESKSSCDVGADAIAGDYKLVGDSWYDGQSCAVQDCVAFNKFQEQLGSEQRCVV
jgi:hypothetical protein